MKYLKTGKKKITFKDFNEIYHHDRLSLIDVGVAVLSYTESLEFRIFSPDFIIGIWYIEALDFRISLIYVLEFRIPIF